MRRPKKKKLFDLPSAADPLAPLPRARSGSVSRPEMPPARDPRRAMPDGERLGLCFRCENRARSLERGHPAPRMQCGSAAHNSINCYAYTPVRPLVVAPAGGEKRPLFAGIVGGRMEPVRVAECRTVLAPASTGDGYVAYQKPLPAAKKKGARK